MFSHLGRLLTPQRRTRPLHGGKFRLAIARSKTPGLFPGVKVDTSSVNSRSPAKERTMWWRNDRRNAWR